MNEHSTLFLVLCESWLSLWESPFIRGVNAAPFEVVVVPINDVSSANLLDELEMCCAFISRARAGRGAVLVHCMAGISRRYSTSFESDRMGRHRRGLSYRPGSLTS